MNGMKYIVYENWSGMEAPVLFPQFFGHENIAKVLTNKKSLISAGFVSLNGDSISAHGESRSLGLESRGSEDADLIRSHLTFGGKI